MPPKSLLLVLSVSIAFTSCQSATQCDEAQAMNKMLALQRVEGRMVNVGGPQGAKLSLALAQESGKISELIAQKKFQEACDASEKVAKEWDLDLQKLSAGMITYEELQKDGGKRGGECSLAEAAQRNMAFHQKLQVQVNEGKADSEIFKRYSEDTKDFAELMATDPSGVCRKLDSLKGKYHIQ